MSLDSTNATLQDRQPKAYPEGWPELHNACNEPCDMLRGPCACGAWHEGDDQAAKAVRILILSLHQATCESCQIVESGCCVNYRILEGTLP